MTTADPALVAKLEWLAEYLRPALDIVSRDEAPLVHELLQFAYLEAFRSAAYLYSEGTGVDPASRIETEETPMAEAKSRAATSGQDC